MITDEMITKAAIEVDAAILAMLPDPSECTHVFSPSFQNKIKKLIRKTKHYVAYKVLRRVACIFIAIFISASMFITLNPTVRAAVVDWVKERFGEFYHYFFVEEGSVQEIIETGETESTEEPDVLKTYNLGWVPDGYILMDTFEVDNNTTFLYVNDIGQMLRFMYIYGSDAYELFMGDDEYEHKHITLNNRQADIYLALNNEKSNAIVWMDDDHDIMFYVSAFSEEDVLVQMALSLTEQEKEIN